MFTTAPLPALDRPMTLKALAECAAGVPQAQVLGLIPKLVAKLEKLAGEQDREVYISATWPCSGGWPPAAFSRFATCRSAAGR
jgi:hypothetical protein